MSSSSSSAKRSLPASHNLSCILSDDGPVSDDRMLVVGEIITSEGIEPYYLRVGPQQQLLPHKVMVTITNDLTGQLFVFARVPSWRTSSHVFAGFMGSQNDPRYCLVDLKLFPGGLEVVISTEKAWEELGLRRFLV